MDRVALPSSRFTMREEEVLCRPCPRCSKACFQLLVVVACLSGSCASLGVSHFNVVFLRFYCLFSLCVFYLFVLCVSQPKWSCGVVLLDT